MMNMILFRRKFARKWGATPGGGLRRGTGGPRVKRDQAARMSQ